MNYFALAGVLAFDVVHDKIHGLVTKHRELLISQRHDRRTRMADVKPHMGLYAGGCLVALNESKRSSRGGRRMNHEETEHPQKVFPAIRPVRNRSHDISACAGPPCERTCSHGTPVPVSRLRRCALPRDAPRGSPDRKGRKLRSGERGFPGIFGNNAIFVIPTSGPDVGIPRCFATAPMESEFTGLFFTPGGEWLLVAVLHPGERYGAGNTPGSGLPGEEVRRIRIAGRDGQIFTQTRSGPMGSNFPSGIPGKAPRPNVLCIRRR